MLKSLYDPAGRVAGTCANFSAWRLAGVGLGLLAASALPALAAPAGTSPEPLYLYGIPVDFILFALTLLGVALFHNQTLYVALAGLAAILTYKLGFTGFKDGPGLGGLVGHMQHEWVVLANLFLLLMGFALLSRHFEKSQVPDVMPAILPDDWKGGFMLLVIVAVISSFLDNIACRADRRRDGARGLQGQGAHRLSGRHRRRLQRRRLGQRGRRHDDHHDVDRRRQPAQRVGGLYRGQRCRGRLRHPCLPAAAQYSPIIKDVAPGVRILWTRSSSSSRSSSSPSWPT
jgi:hypothetical protein